MVERNFYDILLAAMFILAAITFISLLKITAPYGRYSRNGWGPKLNARLAWIIQESPSVIAFGIFFFMGKNSVKAVPIIFFIIWQIHYINRTYIYPFGIRGNKKNAALATASLAFLFTTINSYLNARNISHFSDSYSVEWLTDARFIIGIILFFTGLTINLHSDKILLSLRSKDDSRYRIPYGGFFKFVSCPNYFGELVEWTGWAIATWSLPGLCFAVWTFANLVPRAISHHKWYLEKFPEYPGERKAVIPKFL